ncbi:MAG: GMC family oxidoreductase [Phycisphaerae bacterium]|nr:GMC family oxidoreductase [Gemmatimonadaceae bacterium]
MEIDAAVETPVRTIETECCIIGAGPAGLAVAATLCAAGHDVVLLESGSANGSSSGSDVFEQELNEGSCVGSPYAGLRLTRHRGVGGTTLLWNTPSAGSPGAKYVPLDACDLHGRWEEAPDGWPFTMKQLAPWLRRAELAAGIASFADQPSPGGPHTRLTDRFRDGDVAPRAYHLGSRAALINPLHLQIATASNARLFTHATVVDFAQRGGAATIRVATDGRPEWSVRAKIVVLAAGAVENARLLLVSANRNGWGGDQSAWLGRGFMEHPRDRSITLRPGDASHYAALDFLDSREIAGHSGTTTVLGRLGLVERAVVRGNLLNASATLLPIVQATRERVREVMVRRTGYQGLRRLLPSGGHGWSRHPAPERVFDGFTVLLNVEQPPRRENAITLSTAVDRHGVPRPELRWHWHQDDQIRLQRVRDVFAAALRGADVGNVLIDPSITPDPNAHHHAGTTRMHDDARHGVVNGDGRVHGTTSVFVVGASTFPTAGYANPTLTILAMALRLADHLHATS